jgi:prepilin-type N-terminal cleavage/methylation domain-containing protein
MLQIQNTWNQNLGFTLVELLITIAIIGVLTSVAVPTYRHYLLKARYSEIVSATGPYKLAVIACYYKTNDLAQCDGGTNGIPANITAGTGPGRLDSLTTINGAIIARPKNLDGLVTADSFVLTPTVTASGVLTWGTGGSGVIKGYTD